jgi:hypothetical protein
MNLKKVKQSIHCEKNIDDDKIFSITKKVFNGSGYEVAWEKEKDLVLIKKGGKTTKIKFSLLRSI